MKNGRVHGAILLLNAAAFCFFGVRWLLDPHGMSQPLGIALTNADAVTDAQAVYGGLELGLGLFLGYCGLRPVLRYAGLIAATLALGGLGLSRLAGILMSPGHVTGATVQLLTTDLLGTALNAVFCVALGRSIARERAAQTSTVSLERERSPS